MTYLKTLAFLTLLAGIVLICGCGARNDKFTIRVSGTRGLEFSGEYGFTEVGGQMRGRTDTEHVEGTVPQEYTVMVNVIWCSLEKKSEDGTLRVEILKDGEVVAESQTSQPYGNISAEAK